MREISAGGVVYRRTGAEIKIQLIQDRYGKVSLPKGKMELEETIEQTALREIEEETGIVGRIVEPLETVVYQFNHPEFDLIDKEVHYYLVEAISGSMQPQLEEIRSVEWYSPKAALYKQKQSGYDNNLSVLVKALNKLGLEC